MTNRTQPTDANREPDQGRTEQSGNSLERHVAGKFYDYRYGAFYVDQRMDRRYAREVIALVREQVAREIRIEADRRRSNRPEPFDTEADVANRRAANTWDRVADFIENPHPCGAVSEQSPQGVTYDEAIAEGMDPYEPAGDE